MNEEEHDLETRLRILLPATYQVFDDAVQPRSMGSAGLKFDANGRVAWGDIWGSFCDLAMAGGPPHRGTLLLPFHDSGAEPQGWTADEVSAELCRGLGLVTALYAEPATTPGWVRLYCTSAAMADWLMRAIVMENVSARARGLALELPTGPAFRLHKEIKNVITAVAKTCHYWLDHMPEAQHDAIAALLASMQHEAPLLPPPAMDRTGETMAVLRRSMGSALHRTIGVREAERATPGWLGLEYPSVAAAIWMMRALAVRNVLSRREDAIVFFPIDPALPSANERTLQAVAQAHRLAHTAQNTERALR